MSTPTKTLYIVVHHAKDKNQPWANSWLDDERIQAISTTAEIGTLCEKAMQHSEPVCVHRCGWGEVQPIISCSALVLRVEPIGKRDTIVTFAPPTVLRATPPLSPHVGQNYYWGSPPRRDDQPSVPAMDLWTGLRWKDRDCGVLLLGESWPGKTEPLASYIKGWLAGAGDTTFTQLTEGFLLSDRAQKAKATAAKLWEEITFFNFVPGSVGSTIASRPKANMYAEGTAILKETLPVLRPRGCLIVGYEQSDHSRAIVESFRIPYLVIPHPRSGVAKQVYAFAWDCINRIKL